jgi:hypothetical protein
MPARGSSGASDPASGGVPASAAIHVMVAGAELFGTQVASLNKALAPRVTQYLNALSAGRFAVSTLTPRGDIAVGTSEEDLRAFAELEGPDGRLVEYALQLAVLEAAIVRSKLPLPAILDDPFIDEETRVRAVFQQMLDGMAKADGQLFVVSSVEDLKGTSLTW